MGFVDCDSHVVETDATWSYLDPGERRFRPRVVEFLEPEDSYLAGGVPVTDVLPQRAWVAADGWCRRLPDDANYTGKANIYDGSTLDGNTAARLEDLDALGIDVQLLISTFFIGMELDNPLGEAALARSFNRWMADITSDSGGRLAWALRPPLRLMDRTAEELAFGREHGAVAVHIRGIEHGMFLSDPYFFPLYEQAQDLDLAIVVHLGESIRRTENLPIGQLIPTPAALMGHVHNLMAGFHAVLASDLDQRFPRLRWGFLEGGATWAPAVLQQHARLMANVEHFLHLRRYTHEDLAAKNLYVACETDEDLPYLANLLGPGVLVTGTDYGHNDLGSEIGAHGVILRDPSLDPATARRIVDTNGRHLLGIPHDFRPAPDYAAGTEVPHVRGARSEDGRAVTEITLVGAG